MSNFSDRIIHQTWTSEADIPRGLRDCYASWRESNPDWSYRLWEDDDCDRFIEEQYPDVLERYRSCPLGIQKADIFRVCVVHRFGGVYADLDMMCLRPLDDLLRDHSIRSGDLVLSTEPRAHMVLYRNERFERLICNAFFLAGKGHPVLGEMIRRIPSMVPEKFNTFGPPLFERTVSESTPNVRILDDRWIYPIVDLGLPVSARDESYQRVVDDDYGDAYTVHFWVHTNDESLLERIETAGSCRDFLLTAYPSRLMIPQELFAHRLGPK